MIALISKIANMVIPFFFNKYTPPSREAIDQQNRLFRAKINIELEVLCTLLNSKIRENRKDLNCFFSVRRSESSNPDEAQPIGLTFNLKWRSERKFNYALEYMVTENLVKQMGTDAFIGYISHDIADLTISNWAEKDKFRIR